jgi:hypothetical protein
MTELVASICREFKLGKRYTYEAAARDAAAEGNPIVELQPWLPFGNA